MEIFTIGDYRIEKQQRPGPYQQYTVTDKRITGPKRTKRFQAAWDYIKPGMVEAQVLVKWQAQA